MKTYTMYFGPRQACYFQKDSLKSSNLKDKYGRGVYTQNFPGRETKQQSRN